MDGTLVSMDDILSMRNEHPYNDQYYKTAYEWFELTGIRYEALDPDGWDRRNLQASYKRKISAKEYVDRLTRCTFTGLKGASIMDYQRCVDMLKRNGLLE